MAKDATPAADKAEPLVKVNREKYVAGKTAAGKKSLHNNDPVAQALNGLELKKLYAIAAKFLGVKGTELQAKYGDGREGGPLNTGMQRMNLGNRIRGKIGDVNAEDAEKAKAAKSALKEFQALLA